jgi:hypothetical protein
MGFNSAFEGLNINYEDKWDNDGTILNTYFICYHMIMSQWYNTALYQNQSAIKTDKTH